MTDSFLPHMPPYGRPTDGDGARAPDAWSELAMAITAQAIDAVDHLLRGLELLQQRGRLTEAEVHILAQPARRLKHCGMQAQQIARLQNGQVRQSHEKVDLAYVVASALAERREALALQGITVQQHCAAVSVLVDPTLAYSLVQAMLEAAVQHGSRLAIQLEPLSAAGAVPADHVDPAAPATHGARLMLTVWGDDAAPAAPWVDGVPWLLAQRLAQTDGAIVLQRDEAPDWLRVTAVFSRVVAAPAAAA